MSGQQQLTAEQLAVLTVEERALYDLWAETTPGPWVYNSYSDIHTSNQDMIDAFAALMNEYRDAGYPTLKSGANPEWRRRLNEVDVCIAGVPAHHGDTAVGRHAADAEFTAEAANAMPGLLARLADARIINARTERYILDVNRSDDGDDNGDGVTATGAAVLAYVQSGQFDAEQAALAAGWAKPQPKPQRIEAPIVGRMVRPPLEIHGDD